MKIILYTTDGFRIETIGYTANEYSLFKSHAKFRIGSFKKLETAKLVAQLIYNG